MKGRKFIIATLTAIAMLAIPGLVAAQDGSSGFGKKIAGAWLCQFDLSGLILVSTGVFGADGTVVTSDMSDFGLGIGFDLNTPGYGAWKKTGRLQTKSIIIWMRFAALQDPEGQDGAPLSFARAELFAEYPQQPIFPVQSSGTFTLVDIPLTENPLDPDAAITPGSLLEGNLTCERLVVD